MLPAARTTLRKTFSTARALLSTSGTSNPLPATFLRGGTSKGIFLNRADLPENPSQWDPIFLGIMGSPDPQYGRQLNGMGGGVSSLSKICVVGAPSPVQKQQGFDVEYTFVQVGIRDSAIDISGNCGNLSSMIGVFAVDEGICVPSAVDARAGVATVRSFNTNTQKRIDTTFPVALSDGKCTPLLELEQAEVAGVPGMASQIVLDFVSPGGARTGKLLPTGNPVDDLSVTIPGMPPKHIRASLVDATNPTVFVAAEDLWTLLEFERILPDEFVSDEVADAVDYIRRAGAERMGLDPRAQAQPKIAVLSSPAHRERDAADIEIHAFSMGVLHKAVPMTVGLCLGVASGVEGTVASEIAKQARAAHERGGMLRIRHPGGIVEVGADFGPDGEVRSAKVVRTGRRLMKGVVWW
ncbi:putative isomerase YraM [Grifola frondosa]|uniref:Putative isomerase YraM n=1 Tax=Grifola frondosa TaxID=5627 RepID=A0A1C7LNA9_GRIFR|nr:putative isomerase YraM [Grifola frondosa]